MFEAALNSVGRGVAAAEAVTWLPEAVAWSSLVVGIVLWLVGRRLARVGVVLGMALANGALASILMPLSPWGSPASPMQIALIGVGTGAISGLLMFRPVIAAGSGIGLAALAALAGGVVLHVRPLPAQPEVSIVATALHGSPRTEPGLGGPLGEVDVAALTRQVGEKSLGGLDLEVIQKQIAGSGAGLGGPGISDLAQPESAFSRLMTSKLTPEGAAVQERARGLLERGAERWAGLPEAHRGLLKVLAGIGGALGLVFGIASPRRAAALVTGLVGAALWIPAVNWLWSGVLGLARPEWLMLGTAGWVIVWGGVGLIGAGVQWSGLLGRRDGALDRRGARVA